MEKPKMTFCVDRWGPALRNGIFFLAYSGSLIFFVMGMREPPVLQNLWSPPLASQALDLFLIALLLTAFVIYLIWARKAAIFFYGVMLISVTCLVSVFGPAGFFGGLLVAFCCFMLGCIFLDVTGSEAVPMIDIFAIGLAATILFLTIVGLSQINMRAVFIMLIILSGGGIGFMPSVRKRLTEGLSVALPVLASDSYPWPLLIPTTFIAFSLIYYGANAALPDGAWDPLVMHLMIPTQILMWGHWDFDSTRYAFAAWPLGVDYIYTFAMAYGGELSAKFLNFIIFCGLLIQLYQLSSQLYGTFVARCTLVLFLSIPLALVVTASLFVENTLAFLTLAAVRILLLQNAQKDRVALIGLAVIVSALCVVKLHGLMIATPIVLIAILSQKWKKLSQEDLRIVVAALCLCSLVGVLPYVFAWWSTGNPVFMFKNSFFHSPFWGPTDFVDSRWIKKLSPYLLYRMTFRSHDYMEALPGAIGFSFMTLLVPGLVACWAKPRRPTTVCVMAAVGYLMILLPQMQYIRYFYPIFPILVLICAAGVERLLVGGCAFVRPLVLLFVMSIALLGLFKFPAGAWAQGSANLAAIFDKNQRTALILRQAPERLANEYINSITVNPPRVLYATEPYGAFLKGIPIYIDWYDYSLNSALVKEENPKNIKSIIEAEKVDFIIVNNFSDIPLYQKVALYAQDNFSPPKTIGPLSIYHLSR